MEAVILAGGLGTRLRSVVSDVPKAMAPIGGKPFLHHQMAYWANQGVSRFVLSVGYKFESIRNYFGEKFETCPIEYCIERAPLGTGGGFLLASQLVRAETFLVLNGDTFCDVILDDARTFHAERNANLTLVVMEVARNDRYGTVTMGALNRIVEFRGPSEQTEKPKIHAGIYIFQKSLLSALSSRLGTIFSLERDVLMGRSFFSDNQVFGFESRGLFLDIGTSSDYERAKSCILGGSWGAT